jgi:hypothetical protein
MISFKYALAFLLVLSCCIKTFAQSDSCDIKVSLLTCSPGAELYSIFGHTAIRVKSDSNFDIIYNYGTFDFEDPHFYKNFVKGKLDYFVSAERFDIFMREYEYENRGVIEQDLNMSCEEKYKLFNALRENSKEENKYYKYQYLFDNCSTRPRDIIIKGFNDRVSFKNILPDPPPTYRDMIHEYLDRGKQYWSEFGIDLLLASRIDRKVSNLEGMFLPDYLMKGFDSATVHGRNAVSGKKVLIRNMPALNQGSSWFTPLLFTTLLLLTGGILLFLRLPWARHFANVFDIAYFLILGLMGCFMLFMWFGTDHELCRDNFNLLWALPTHVVMSFFILKKRPFVRKYFGIAAIFSAIVLISIPILPQELNTAFLPLILLSLIRSAARALKK